MAPSLPDFANPPLVEAALSVQLEPLNKFRTPQMGFLWAEFRRRFPEIEEHPPLDPVIEQFGVQRSRKVGVRLQMIPKLPTPRCWFLTEFGTELIQVQQDRFVHNWRKVGEGDEYPRYEYVRDKFQEELSIFDCFLRREKIGELVPSQCEITYEDDRTIKNEDDLWRRIPPWHFVDSAGSDIRISSASGWHGSARSDGPDLRHHGSTGCLHRFVSGLPRARGSPGNGGLLRR